MKFEYSRYELAHGKSIYRPSMPIMFTNGEDFIYTEAMIDSGADYTVLPIEMAGALNLKLEAKAKMVFYGAGSNPFTVYPSPVKIVHMLRKDGFRNIQWEATVYFSEAQPTILLGNKGFLEYFRVTLDGKKKEVEIVE